MKNIFILPNKTIQNALLQLDKTGESCLLVINNKKQLLGTITDGDLRRFILKNPEMKKLLKRFIIKIQNLYFRILILKFQLKI